MQNLLFCVQEYKEVLEKLRLAYFSNVTSFDQVRRQNIALMTDINFRDSVIKNVVLQSIANNKNADQAQNRNTFMIQ